MSDAERARRSGVRLQIALVVVAAVAVAVHLSLTYAILGTLDRRLVVLDAGLAVIGIAVGLWYIGALVEERQRQALEGVLMDVLTEPRNINDTARVALAVLAREELSDAATIALADEQATAMYPIAARGYPDRWVRSAPAEPLPDAGERPALERLREPHPWVDPVRTSVAKRPWVARIPLQSGHDPIGMLLLTAAQPGMLRNPAVLDTIAVQLSAALDHAAMYEAAYRRERDLEEQDQRRREFMAAISHEVRTPLTSIQAFTELLQLGRPAMDETADQLVTSLSHGVDRLHSLMTDLIDLGRAGGFEYKVDLEEVDIADLLRRASEVLRPAILLREQTLHFELPEEPLVALADAKLLEQVVLNILSNANRHAPAGGEVVLAALPAEPGRVRIEVRDSGPGIDERDRALIFEPYYRVQRENAAGVPGSGLGLAIARRMVDALGGEIWVEDRDEPGACFCIEVRAAAERQLDAPVLLASQDEFEEPEDGSAEDALTPMIEWRNGRVPEPATEEVEERPVIR
jgi:signal transduction histidine kinase